VRSKTLGVFALPVAWTLVACVTVNVYFPAAEVKDLSRRIEEEVRKEAAKQEQEKPPEPSPTPSPSPSPSSRPSVSLLDAILGVTPVFAQEVAAPEVTSPAIRKIIDSRAARVGAIRPYKATGVVGENNKGLLEIRKLDALTDLKSRAEAQRLVAAENADREELFREIATAKKVDPSQLPKIRETYASTIREMASAGTWIQMPDGTWRQK
jgi:uncharacterized protein YdbL (DUF1318 family)